MKRIESLNVKIMLKVGGIAVNRSGYTLSLIHIFILWVRLYWHKLQIRNFGVSLQGKICRLAFFAI